MLDRLHLLILFFVLCSLNTYGQNYNPIVSNNTSLFESGSYIEALHVDSTASDPKGLVHYFIKTWESEASADPSNCLSFQAPTWAGPKCLLNDSSAFFFNLNMDSICLKPLKEINDSWVCYTYNNGQYIEATVSKKEWATFLGLNDSLKTISFQLKDINGNNVTSNINTLFIELSKNHGLVTTMNFLAFPYFISPTTYTTTYSLVGLTNPQLGKQLISARNIYTYEVGDEFHYEAANSNPPHGIGIFNKSIHTILNVSFSNNTDTVTYQVKQYTEKNTINYDTNQETDTYTTDTVTEIHVLNQPMSYPEQANKVNDFNPELWKFSIYNLLDQNHNRLLLSTSTEIPMSLDNANCWHYTLSDPSYYYSFADGLGMVSRTSSVSPPGQDYEQLVYFKKGSETWGSALVLSTYSKSDNSSTVLYPNPLKQGDPLFITTNNFQVSQILIYNTTGNKVFAATTVNGSSLSTFDLSALQQGFYSVQLLNKKNESLATKLIIK